MKPRRNGDTEKAAEHERVLRAATGFFASWFARATVSILRCLLSSIRFSCLSVSRVPAPVGDLRGGSSLYLRLSAFIGGFILLSSCQHPSPEVVVYCSLDEPYAQPILTEYARRSGVRVVPLFDTEATKSVGLA